jgi:hypothetical protein
MNVTDLRIAFKMDTGQYPLWSQDHDGKDLRTARMKGRIWPFRVFRESPPKTTFLKGHPRTIYGLWLEDKIGKPKYLRDRFYKVTGETPNKFYFGPIGNKDVLFGDYIEWLETFYLKLVLRNDSV